MTRTRTSKPFALGAALASFCALAVTSPPMAQADDALAPIVSTVKKDRGGTRCNNPLNYNFDLEATAQTYARSENIQDGITSAYNGKVIPYLGSGDPQAAATTSAYSRGAGPAISDCNNKDFGVGFIRHEDRSVDVVTIVFGQPPKPPDPVVVPPVPKPPPTNVVDVTFTSGLQWWTVNVTNNSPDIGGKCTYNATSPPWPPTRKNFDIAPKGNQSFQVPAPPPLTTWHVVTSCHGTWQGQDVEFGHNEQDVP